MASLDSIFRALARKRRRDALDCLQRHHTVSLADLAEFVAAREQPAAIDRPQPQPVLDIYCSLYHEDIPILERAELAQYTQEADMVRLADEATQRLERTRGALDEIISNG